MHPSSLAADNENAGPGVNAAGALVQHAARGAKAAGDACILSGTADRRLHPARPGVISPHERPASQVTITTSGNAASVAIDGHEIRAVSKVSLTLGDDGPPVLKLSLLAASGLNVDGEAVIVLDKAACRALEAMGWTPPASGKEECGHTHKPGDMPEPIDLWRHMASAHGMDMTGSGYITISDTHDALHGHERVGLPRSTAAPDGV